MSIQTRHCLRCGRDFKSTAFLGYCEECREAFAADAAHVAARQNPAPGVVADGAFARMESPRSVFDPERRTTVCGLCGSADLMIGYGLGSGHGMGSYNFCQGCNSFLDFVEDAD